MKKFVAAVVVFSLLLSCQQLSIDPDYAGLVQNNVVVGGALLSTFAKNYGGIGDDRAASVVKTSDDGYALLGTSNSDFYFIKTDKNGKLQWQRKYGTPDLTERGNNLKQTPDGGYILIGSEDQMVKVIKTDKNGNIQWQTNYGDINAYLGSAIALTGDNGYVGVGMQYEMEGGGVAVFKLNSSGHLIWIKYYILATAVSIGNSIERTSDNGFIIGGYSWENYDVVFNLNMLKIDSKGNVQWKKAYGGDTDAYGLYAKQTRDGGYICVGNKKKSGGQRQIYVVRTDSQGRYKWIKGYYPSEYSSGYKLCELSDGSFVIIGKTFNKPTIMKINSSGTVIWKQNINESIMLEPKDIAIACDGGYAVSGEVVIDSAGLGYQAALVKTNKNGQMQ